MTKPATTNSDTKAMVAELTQWLIQQGLENAPVDVWLEELCTRLVANGLPLMRVNLSMRAHHPEIGSVAFRWHRDKTSEKFSYERSGTQAENTLQEYLKSPLYHLTSNPITELHQRLDIPDPELDFPMFDDLRAQGGTDYFAVKRRFKQSNVADEDALANTGEGMTMSLVTDAQGGFTDAHLDTILAMLRPICLTLKCGSTRTMAEDITATYLGVDASKRVLSGDIIRGSSETISAVIWYFDLQGFTKLSEALGGAAVIDLLNDYFAEAVAIVEKHGGNVLKFMGDGMLAIFDLETVPNARAVAIEAAVEMRETVTALNETRVQDGLPTTGFTLGLHAGDVLYGNIGGKTRLDFTVIGPAVNTTSRILGMCSAVDQTIVISAAVAAPLRDTRPDLVSLGQYRLRGVRDRQELFYPRLTIIGNCDLRGSHLSA